MWHKCQDYAKRREYQKAYALMLSLGDDMYLLRLVVQTGPVTKFLEPDTSKQVLKQLNRIVRRGIFEQMECEWVDDAKRSGVMRQMSMVEQNEYMDTLWLVMRSDMYGESLKVRAQEVYTGLRADA